MTVTAKQETYFAVYAVLSGQGHEAVLPAPELFLCEVLGFFERI